MLLGIDLEQERRLDAIEARLDAIEQQDRTRVDTGAGTRTERENRQG
jgi:hypothetical protein